MAKNNSNRVSPATAAPDYFEAFCSLQGDDSNDFMYGLQERSATPELEAKVAELAAGLETKAANLALGVLWDAHAEGFKAGFNVAYQVGFAKGLTLAAIQAKADKPNVLDLALLTARQG